MPEKANHSPRISFSQDFCYYDSIPIEQSPLRPPSESSCFNFDFSVPGGVIYGESSWSAEEFFSDGKIVPTEIKKRPEPEMKSFSESSGPGRPKPETNPIGDVKPVHEIDEIDEIDDEEEYEEIMVIEEKPNCKPFWGFKKVKKRPVTVPGNSLPKPETNQIGDVKPVVEIEGGKATVVEAKPNTIPNRNVKPVHEIEEIEEEKPNTKPFWGFKKRSNSIINSEIGLPLLSNNQTGSNSKKTETTELQVSSSSSSSSNSKEPLKKNYYGGYNYGGNGGEIKVNSFLDMIPSGSLFGLGSIIFGSGSDKNKKRSLIFYW
ncbi:unnamed protein product [Thlaspi arvense]|uniref:Uncharacterized protein n=1 Tax=Thlaspi arvense TaxID=13288 RepID=A0AAU9T4A0_THLAR|nr:unnamed protein product [Thlaspi arvense]